MTTETKIAEENIYDVREAFSISHKASCQRFLEFLEGYFGEEGRYKVELPELEVSATEVIRNKITDLKNAIKKYDEAGI